MAIEHRRMTNEELSGLYFKSPLRVKCKICEKDQGYDTHVLGDNWIICDDCRKEKEEAEKEIEKEVERRVRLEEKLDKKKEEDPENYCDGVEWDNWSNSGDRITELRDKFNKKFYR